MKLKEGIMMKLFFVLPFLVQATYALECDDYFGCVNKVLNRGESIQVAEKFPHFTLYKVRGVIDNSTFALLDHLEELYIENSDITFIEEGAICNFRNLRKLHITFNNPTLNVTKRMLGNCYNVESLSISGHYIEENALENMPHLHDLILDATNIPRSICTSHKLRLLTLEEITDKNILESQLRFCRNLEEMNIASVLYIDPYIFNDKVNLKSIDIYKVPMNHITRTYFTGLQNLKFLRLDDCSVDRIDGDAFDDLRQLKSLTITFSSVSLHPRHLGYLTNLEELILKQRTSLDTLHYLNNFPKLEYINIEVDDLSRVRLNIIFRNLPSLRKLEFFQNSNICYNSELVKLLEAYSSPRREIKMEDGLAHTGFC